MIPVAAWLVATVIALVDVGQASDSEIACGAAEASTASLLQLGQAQLQSRQECGHLIAEIVCNQTEPMFCTNHCDLHTHGADCYRPIADVLAEHPGVDGYCYFNYTAFWVQYLGPIPDFEAEAVVGIMYLRSMSEGPKGYQGVNSGRLLNFNFEGAPENLTTHMDLGHYLYDDLYGYSLGFLQGQGLDPAWMHNSSHWISLSRQKCEEIQDTYNFSKEELVVGEWIDWNAVIDVMTACSAGVEPFESAKSVRKAAGWNSLEDCKPITRREYAKHHYVKCMLGYRNSASDMAYLNARACLLEGNRIGHLEECPYNPMPGP